MRKTLLLLEDNDSERDGMSLLLRSHGYDVVAVASAEEGIDSLQRHNPDLILLDMMMRGSDGWRFLDLQRGEGKLQGVPIVIMTGLTVASEAWAKALGADGFLRKPIDLEPLLETIQQRLN